MVPFLFVKHVPMYMLLRRGRAVYANKCDEVFFEEEALVAAYRSKPDGWAKQPIKGTAVFMPAIGRKHNASKQYRDSIMQ